MGIPLERCRQVGPPIETKDSATAERPTGVDPESGPHPFDVRCLGRFGRATVPSGAAAEALSFSHPPSPSARAWERVPERVAPHHRTWISSPMATNQWRTSRSGNGTPTQWAQSASKADRASLRASESFMQTTISSIRQGVQGFYLLA